MTLHEFPSKGGVPICQLAYGVMGHHAFYTTEPTPQDQFEAFMDSLVQTMPNPVMIDTSDVYTLTPKAGDNEVAIGKWLAKGNRDKVFLATKFAMGLEPGVIRTQEQDAIEACEASLKRLQTDHIDLYYCHRPDRNKGVDSTAKGLKALKDSGKIRYTGVSEFNLDEMKQVNSIVHLDAVQIEVSPWAPEFLYNGMYDWCKENGTALVPYSPLGRGALAGKFTKHEDIPEGDWRRQNERFSEENLKKNLAIVDDIKKIANLHKATPGQVTLAWLMAQGDHVFPIPGTTNLERLKENAGSLNLKLTPEDLEEMTALVKQFKAAGARYPEAMSKNLGY